MAPLVAFLEGGMSLFHWLLVLVIGILLFGKRLPDIGRTVGKSLVEFKKRWLTRNPSKTLNLSDEPEEITRCQLCPRNASVKPDENIHCDCGRFVCPRHICHKRCDSCGKLMCGGCVKVFYRELAGTVDSLGRPKFRREMLHYCPECYKAA
jgi:TatA/E family protein of Tat protein translocase